MSTPLRRTLPYRPWAVWLAVLIAVFGALAPTVSHALVLAQGGIAGSLEICTPQGMRFVTADPTGLTTDSPDGPESVLSLSECPFCLHTTDRVAPPAHPWVYIFVVSNEFKVPTVRQAFLLPLPFAPTPPPRGPPAAFLLLN
jgi:hypothetical protein